MINVSKEFQTAIKERTDFLQYGKITFTDGTVLDLAPADFTISNNKVIDSAGSSRIPLGSVVCRSIQIELMNDDERYSSYDFFGAVIKIQAKLQLSETVETVDFGEFTVVTPETYGETVIITAVDDVWKTDREFTTTLVFPTTTGALLRDICSLCDLSLGTTTFRNSDFEIQSIPDGNYTFRAVIGYIAQIAGGNARINRYGKLEIISYDFATLREKYSIYDGGYYNPWNNEIVLDGGTFSPWTNGENIDGGTYGDRDSIHLLYQWSYIKVDTDDVVITGVQTEYTNDADEKVTLLEGIEGYVLGIDNPLIAGKESEAIKLIGAVMIGAQFRQFEGDHISYPLAEFMDPCWIVDRKNHVYTSIITDINFSFWGLTTLKNSAETAVRNSSQYSSEATKSYIKAQKLVVKERTDREKAVENLAKALSDAGGLYMTTETLEDGSSIYYMHDKPTLKESKIVWKLTSLAFGISTDGGKTYPYGFTVDGELITRLLYAEGINADYITSGTINADLINLESTFEESGYVAVAKLVGGGVKISKYALSEGPNQAAEVAQLSGVNGEKSGSLVLRKNGLRDITVAAGGGRGVQIWDKTNGSSLVAAMYRNDEWDAGAIQLLSPQISGSSPFFYVGMSNANYRMQFSKWVFSTLGTDDDRMWAGDKIILQNVGGVRKGYFDHLNVGGSTMTTLVWKWSSDLGAFVLTGTQ